jgi:hypothetical protein
MQYPLPEKIGNPDLLVGREKEFEEAQRWLDWIPGRLAQSRVILARRKSGKTAFVQRIFNKLWSENGKIIPFYLDIPEIKAWLPTFAIKYYCAFASQYISFMERDETLVRNPLSLEEIKDYGITKSISFFVRDVNFILQERIRGGLHDLVWETAHTAPHRFASVYDKRFLVILDEFQNFASYIYRDEACQGKADESMPGSFHSLSESKIAPMLVTGSYVGWLLEICGKYLQAGRLDSWYIPPYLTPEDGLQAVYKYAEVYNVPITNETAILINRLCMSDPYFISCVIKTDYENPDLTTEEGVVNAVNYEITDRKSRMSKTWDEYIQLTLLKIDDRHAKNMLLFLNKHPERYWSTHELKQELSLDLDLDEIKKKLILMVEADVIEWGSSDIQFRGLQDGTLNLIIRNRFEEEIKGFIPDLKDEFREKIAQLEKEKKSLQGKLNYVSGLFAEYQLVLSFRSRKRFALSEYFDGVRDEATLNIVTVKQRVPIQRENGKNMELDVIAESDCGRVAAVEVKKLKTPTGRPAVEVFYEKIKVYAQQVPDKTLLPAFLSLGGFTDEALEYCKTQGIGTAERIEHF